MNKLSAWKQMQSQCEWCRAYGPPDMQCSLFENARNIDGWGHETGSYSSAGCNADNSAVAAFRAGRIFGVVMERRTKKISAKDVRLADEILCSDGKFREVEVIDHRGKGVFRFMFTDDCWIEYLPGENATVKDQGK